MLEKKAADIDATIVFADETGFSLCPTVRRTWAPRGCTPIVKHRFNWKRLHAVGAIACSSSGDKRRLYLQLQAIPANSESTIHFLSSLGKQFPGNVLLVWDGLPAHRSRTVKEYIEQQKWLTVAKFPPYAPELNPVEYLWSALKTKYTANIDEDTIKDLGDRIERAYSHYADNEKTLAGFLKASSLYGETQNSG